MNTIMNDIYEIAVSYIYTTVEPYAPRAFPYLQDIIRILESHHIDLPDLNLLSEYTAKKTPRDGKVLNGWAYLLTEKLCLISYKIHMRKTASFRLPPSCF